MAKNIITYSPTLFEDSLINGLFKPVRSPLNYIGGKFKLLPQMINFFPSEINTFVDLFCGGCNVGINVISNHTIFNDNLTYLIDFYNALNTMQLPDILNHIRDRVDEFKLSLTNAEGYLELRKLYNTCRNPIDLFVLVAFSFNHQIRFNSSHQFNNPFGRARSSFNPTMERNLIEFVNRLHNISCEFTSLNFDDFKFDFLSERDLVYCDPPYMITTGTYNDGKRGFTGWSQSEDCRLLDILDMLDSKGVRFALSNVLSHKGMTNNNLKEWACNRNYRIIHLSKSYANSNYHTKDRRQDSSDEVLIINYKV